MTSAPDPSGGEPSPGVAAAMLVIGNEILSGRTRDANLATFAVKLAARGIRIRELRVVADVEADIVAALNALRAAYDLVFTTGGIGPTHDDITADAVARAFGRPIGEDPRAVALLEAYYGTDGAFTPGRRRMARLPEGAALIENRVSAAPGFRIENVYVMAGVPRIAEAMLDAVMESLPRGRVRHKASLTGRVAEGRIAESLRAIQAAHPAIEIGSYPSYAEGGYRTAIVMTGTDLQGLALCKAEVAALMRAEGVEPEDDHIA
jgi:molybdenum cofactor synthesis domain-containing protein